MDLDCLNDIITDDLAIHIDLTDLNSWDLNTGLTSFSLTKWLGAKSDNLNLYDFGLTGFDNGRTDEMWNGIMFTPQDTLFSMYRVGYNIVKNPTSGETSGVTVNTEFLPISGITTGNTGNYFELAGGYLQGFFKLDGYDYELLPSRYNNGITIETIIYQTIDSHGIFYMMGARAEDKYNPFFSGETMTGGSGGNITSISGVTTSEDNYLDAIETTEEVRSAFRDFSQRMKTVNIPQSSSGNTTNNAIAFEITQDKKLAYKYIDENGLIKTNVSPRTMNSYSGWTIIAISFKPDEIIDDPDLLECYPQRTGKLIMYVNGRAHWIINDFPEYYFKGFNNDREKQLGVPYSISWGGGSFGLKNSWHYQMQTYGLYNGEDQTYIEEKFLVESQPIPEECDPFPSDIPLDGISLSADSSNFIQHDNCDPNITYPVTVMKIEYTGGTSGTTTGMTGQTGTSANTYFIKFDQPIVVLSNRDYVVSLDLFNDGFFKTYDENNQLVENNVSLFVYGTEDVDIVDEGEYKYPLTSENLQSLPNVGVYPFPDRQEYQYLRGRISYFGDTGLPVYTDPEYYLYYGVSPVTNQQVRGSVVTGQNTWLPLSTTFRIKDNTGKQIVYIGILIQTTNSFNENSPLFVKEFKYKGADNLAQDPRKQNLLIEQNFNSSYIGGIQKLRVYTTAFTSQQIMHNALMEMKNNPGLNLQISKGGRVIYR
jgi:hypothetical protein